MKYNVYLSDKIEVEFQPTDRSRVELAARLLKLASVDTEVKKEGGKDVWYIKATTDMLAAGRKELRDAVRKVVEETLGKGWVDEKKAELWLEKLEEGLTLMEGWPKYHVGLARSGALVVRFTSPNPDSIQQVARRLNEIGLVEGRHFTVKMPEEGRYGYVSILKEGLAYVAWLSVYGEGDQRELAEAFVKHILRRAEEAGKEVYEKVKEIVEEGKARGSQTLRDLEKWVEVNGKTYVVKVIGWSAEPDKGRGDRKLLRIKITAEVGRVEGEHIVDRVVREYEITYGRYGSSNATRGFAVARADAPGGREADAERLAAVIKAITGKEPRVYRKSGGAIIIVCYEGHLDGFARYAELADAIEKWLSEEV